MKKRLFAGLVIAGMLFALISCNLPTNPGASAETATLPAANQTLTALFSIPIGGETATATLPPVVTATSGAGGDNNTGGGQEPTATNTQQPAASSPTATQAPPTATMTKAPAQATKTNTSAPPTATVPSARTNVKAVANFLSTPPNLDGDWSEWKNLTTEYPLTNVVYGASNWKDENDLSASYHVGWDNNYLYIAVKVHDDKYVQNATGENIYKGDSIEILFDTKLQEDYYYDKLSPDDFQLGISPGNPDPSGTKEAYLWFPSNIKGSKSGVKIAAKAETGGYRIEAAIPWTLLEMTPQSGMHYGFVISVSDNDDSTKNVQQTMISSDPNRSLVDPTTWGDVQLVK